MSRPDVDVVVVGAGLMGAATAWAASRRGLSVAVYEQFGIGHDLGSSHGSARIFRYPYPDPFYSRLVGRAAQTWRELEVDAGVRLVRVTGGLDYGSERDPVALAGVLSDLGIAHELLPAAEAARRWPGIRFDGPALFQPDAGVLDAAATVRACLERTLARGGSVRAQSPVRSLVVQGDSVIVSTDTDQLRAGRVVVAAGAWVAELLAGVAALPAITVTQELTAHFRRRSEAGWPTFVYKSGFRAYGLAAGADTGDPEPYKVAEYLGGPRLATPSQRVSDNAAALARLVDFVRSRLPGLDPDPIYQSSCLFTMTPHEDFVLDRRGPVVVCSPCSGHGAKFAPLIGELAADLVEGKPVLDSRFALP